MNIYNSIILISSFEPVSSYYFRLRLLRSSSFFVFFVVLLSHLFPVFAPVSQTYQSLDSVVHPTNVNISTAPFHVLNVNLESVVHPIIVSISE